MITLESTTSSVLIRNPIFGDSKSCPLGIKIKTARSGAKWAYSRPIKLETLTMQFRGLDRDKVTEIINFRNQVIGQEITLRRDDFNEVWRGKLLNDPMQTTQESRSSSTLEIVFQGTQIA